MTDAPTQFDPEAMCTMFSRGGHPGWLNLRYNDHGDNWVALELPWREDLLGEEDRLVLASGPIISLLDMASGMSIWTTAKAFEPIATLDLRVDYQRPAKEHSAVIGRRIYEYRARSPKSEVAGWQVMNDAASKLTPYARSLGIEVDGYEGVRPILAIDFSNIIEGRPGAFHGGATAGLLETAGYAALRAQLAADGRKAVLKPVNITVQYLAAGLPKRTFALGRITRLGRRSANVTVEAWQDDRAQLIASAVMNIMIAQEE